MKREVEIVATLMVLVVTIVVLAATMANPNKKICPPSEVFTMIPVGKVTVPECI